jgi:hypothetical protein
MKARAVDAAVAVAGLAILLAIALVQTTHPPSTYSSFDTGPNGYRALYDVLAREGVRVRRFGKPVARMPANARVYVITSTLPELKSGEPYTSYDRHDIAKLRWFASHGGRILLFVTHGSQFAKLFTRDIVSLDVDDYTNLSLSKQPRKALRIYQLVAHRGLVLFDERIHGYVEGESTWSVLPAPVRAAFWVAIAVLALVLVEANVRWLPPIPVAPPEDRDSSAYIASMASLLRRARAASAAIARFAEDAMRRHRSDPRAIELQKIAATKRPNDAALLRAARLYAALRKDHA